MVSIGPVVVHWRWAQARAGGMFHLYFAPGSDITDAYTQSPWTKSHDAMGLQ